MTYTLVPLNDNFLLDFVDSRATGLPLGGSDPLSLAGRILTEKALYKIKVFGRWPHHGLEL
jgi:hypothetical protein